MSVDLVFILTDDPDGRTRISVTHEAFEADFRSLPRGRQLTAKVVASKSAKQVAWYHWRCGELIKGGVWDGTVKSLKNHVLGNTGFYTETMIEGKLHLVIDSIRDMSDAEFLECCARTEKFVSEAFGVEFGKYRPDFDATADQSAEPVSGGPIVAATGAASSPAGDAVASGDGEGAQPTPALSPEALSLLGEYSAALWEVKGGPRDLMAASRAFITSNEAIAHKPASKMLWPLYNLHLDRLTGKKTTEEFQTSVAALLSDGELPLDNKHDYGPGEQA